MTANGAAASVPDPRFGRLESESVGQLVNRHAAVFRALPLVLVASIDSGRNPAEMPWAREQILADATWAKTTDPLIVSGAALVEQHERRELFSGYDELWILDGLAAAPPRGASLVCPRRLDERLPLEVEGYLRSSGSRLGLGDGDEGLNYITVDRSLAAQLGLLDAP